MPAQVVLVHDDSDFTVSTVAALRHLLGDEKVALFADSMTAVDALEEPQKIELLITLVDFPERKPNGVFLALMARMKRPDVKILFLAPRDAIKFTIGIGEVLVIPATPDDVATKVREMLGI